TLAGLMIFSEDAAATVLPPGTEPSAADPAATAAAVATGEHLRPTASTGTFHRSDTVRTGTSDHDLPDTTGWTSGVIEGDVQLPVSVLDRLGAMTVIVEPMRNPFGTGPVPKKIMQPVERGLGTPTFRVENVAFSEYPYRVTIYAAGLNCTDSTVIVNEDQPWHAVQLQITPPAPFSVLLRDQDARPHVGVDLVMRPVGLPHGRPRLAGTTDNFGSVVFEEVLQGAYEIRASVAGQPFGEPEQITVQGGRVSYGRKIQGQGHVMTIPRGVPLDVQVHDAFGYGIEGCRVLAIRTDTRRGRPFEATTDGLGNVRFPHLTPGTWQLTVERPQFQRVDRQIHIAADTPPERMAIKLVRARSLR
ncbi:MAG TPA: carboxypeptidase regulatory-like domain-containing protein, partial [bacterium]|nr:carboxypeptidase regulatory-like domain-containing protein [bacterium]